jgi:hypothetical protein
LELEKGNRLEIQTGYVNKHCNNNGSCNYKSFSNFGWLCGYTGYCDYQAPRDSRLSGVYKSNEGEKK